MSAGRGRKLTVAGVAALGALGACGAPRVAPPAPAAPASTSSSNLAPRPPAAAPVAATGAAEPTPRAAEPHRYAVVGVSLDDTLRVREAPDPAARELGALGPTAMGLEVLSPPVASSGGSWVKVRFVGGEGWVNRRYLAEQRGQAPESLLRRSHEALALLRELDLKRLAALVHPERGLRFSPHGFIAPEAQHVSAPQLERWAATKVLRKWGEQDGTGEPITLTFADYHRKYVVDRDYRHPDELALSPLPQRGNEYDNIEELFPGASAVEYYVEARDHGLDWRSLRLVFLPVGDVWYLVAVLHVTWTI